MNIGKYNRRITIKSWTTTQDDGGGVERSPVNNYTIWAKVEPRNGNLFLGEQQRIWSYDYKVSFRYEKSRIVTSDMTIHYDGKELAINSLSIVDEGKRGECIARCTTLDKSES